VTKGASEPWPAGWQASWSLIGYHGRLASLWLVRQDLANSNSGSPPSCGLPFWQWSVASPCEMFVWQVRYLDIYLFYVYVWYGPLHRSSRCRSFPSPTSREDSRRVSPSRSLCTQAAGSTQINCIHYQTPPPVLPHNASVWAYSYSRPIESVLPPVSHFTVRLFAHQCSDRRTDRQACISQYFKPLARGEVITQHSSGNRNDRCIKYEKYKNGSN